jgi:hypothetical protein
LLKTFAIPSSPMVKVVIRDHSCRGIPVPVCQRPVCSVVCPASTCLLVVPALTLGLVTLWCGDRAVDSWTFSTYWCGSFGIILLASRYALPGSFPALLDELVAVVLASLISIHLAGGMASRDVPDAPPARADVLARGALGLICAVFAHRFWLQNGSFSLNQNLALLAPAFTHSNADRVLSLPNALAAFCIVLAMNGAVLQWSPAPDLTFLAAALAMAASLGPFPRCAPVGVPRYVLRKALESALPLLEVNSWSVKGLLLASWYACIVLAGSTLLVFLAAPGWCLGLVGAASFLWAGNPRSMGWMASFLALFRSAPPDARDGSDNSGLTFPAARNPISTFLFLSSDSNPYAKALYIGVECLSWLANTAAGELLQGW